MNENWLPADECCKAMKLSPDILRVTCANYIMKKVKRKHRTVNARHYELNSLLDLARAYKESIASKGTRKRTAKFVIRKRCGAGLYKKIPKKEYPPLSGCVSMSSIAQIEQSLNHGLLCEQAEAAYPRMGMHTHPIYKVVPSYKK